jgi:hypothetical protein
VERRLSVSAQRQLRVRVLAAIEDRVRGFRRREELWPLRVPAEPILLDDVVEQALAGEMRTFDPAALRTRPLLRLEWADGSAWTAWVLGLPSGFRIYGDTSDEESRLLASGGRNEGDASDRAFLELLAESAGGHFGIEMTGGAPSRVRSAIDDREFLVDLFVNLLEVTGAEESVRAQLNQRPHEPPAGGDGRDFRIEVARWLHSAHVPRDAR